MDVVVIKYIFTYDLIMHLNTITIIDSKTYVLVIECKGGMLAKMHLDQGFDQVPTIETFYFQIKKSMFRNE